MRSAFSPLFAVLFGTFFAVPFVGQTYTTIDFPGASATYALVVNSAGEVAGGYSDARNVNHGFVRAANGTFAGFDAPAGSTSVVVSAMNGAGAVAGYYVNKGGFSRAS
jgi:uncharacterized membrane protein